MSQRLVRILLSLLSAAMVMLVVGCGEDDIITPEITTVTDIDGNVYETVTIGAQEWMKKNLKVTHYRNGDSIPHVTDSTAWSSLSSAAYCEHSNSIDNVATYGRLYNWFAVADSRNIAPEGWHVPTDEEWQQLEVYLGISQAQADSMGWRGTDEGGKLKATGTTHWTSPNTGATNESGFSALPGGLRSEVHGRYHSIGWEAIFWSSAEYSTFTALVRDLSNDHSDIGRFQLGKKDGYSVRCVKD